MFELLAGSGDCRVMALSGMAFLGMAFLGTTPIGAILVAWLATSFNARAPFLAGGTVVMLTGTAMLMVATRRAREVARLHERVNATSRRRGATPPTLGREPLVRG